jgi:hypothetical protein
LRYLAVGDGPRAGVVRRDRQSHVAEGGELHGQVATRAVDGLGRIERVRHAEQAGRARQELGRAHGTREGDAVRAAARFDLDDGREQAARYLVLALSLCDRGVDVGVAFEEADRPVQGIPPEGSELVAQEERRQRKYHRIAEERDGQVEQAQRGQEDRRPAHPARDALEADARRQSSPLARHSHP